MKFLLDNWILIFVCLGSGGMLAWQALSGTGRGGLSVQAVVQLINRQRGVLVDVRAADAFAAGHAVGARNLPLEQLESQLGTSVKNKALPLLLICETGQLAQRAAATAKKLGYEQAQAVAGGLRAWKEANLPVEKA